MKKQIARVESEIRELRKQKAEAIDEREAAKAALSTLDTFDEETAEFKAASEATDRVRALEESLAAKSDQLVSLLKMVGADEPDERGSDARVVGERAEKALGWDARKITDGDAYKALADSPALHAEKAHIGNVVLGRVVERDAMKAELGSADLRGLIRPDFRGLAPVSYQPLTVLDLMPSGSTDSNLIEYVQATTRATAAGVVAEGDRKAEQTLGFEDADAPVRTIAGYLKVRKQALADAAGLRAYIDEELRYDVRRALQREVISGDGTGQHLTGLLRTNGVLEPDVSRFFGPADKVHRGITVVRKAGHAPTGVLINPDDYELIRLTRDGSGGSATTGGYLFGAPTDGGTPNLWGLPPVLSEDVPLGTAVVGAFQHALVLYREGVTVLVSDSDQDDFVRNRVTILAETRATLLVLRPDAFAVVDLGTGEDETP